MTFFVCQCEQVTVSCENCNFVRMVRLIKDERCSIHQWRSKEGAQGAQAPNHPDKN